MAEIDCKPACAPNTPAQWPFATPDSPEGANGPNCMPPMQFCFSTTSTGPVQHPGRVYDITLPINPGFAVQTLQVDQTLHPANIVWDVSDPDGEQFRQSLTTFMEGRLPGPATVTIANPNAGNVICGTAQPFEVHIECLRLDQNPPNLIELVYNGGQDLVINPAYNENPPLNPPVAQGDYGYHLLARQDDPGPFPGNQPAGDAVCTNVAGRGWETNDVGRTFEIWGRNIVQAWNVTPTPRGTPVQEITSDGAPSGGRSTIWQTFQAPANGNFKIRVVHGGRSAGENHIITLDNGDTDDQQNGDLINNVTNNVGVVTNGSGNGSAGNPGPWTVFDQEIPLVGGSTYTLALSTNNPASSANGGLFTDMRAFIDRPDMRATAATDDNTCSVETQETTETVECRFYQPTCELIGDTSTITSWKNVATGEVLTNEQFWAQTPPPSCCVGEGGTGGGGASDPGNLVINYEVCGVIGGVRTTLQRLVLLDQTGGVIGAAFVGPDGAPVTPASGWTIGACPAEVGEYGAEFAATQVCIRREPLTQQIATTNGAIGDVDPNWEWTPDDVNSENEIDWYPTYRLAPHNATWTASDTAVPPISGWIGPHPGGGLTSTGAPGEGPTISTDASLTVYTMRRSFILPPNVDLDSIETRGYVLNAAGRVARLRTNNNLWITPLNPTGQDDPSNTYPNSLAAGLQPGLNRLYVQVGVPNGWTDADGTGLNYHMELRYRTTDVPRSWTRVILDNGTVSYIDEDGTPQASLPAGHEITHCNMPEPQDTRINMLYTTTVEDVNDELIVIPSQTPAGLELVSWSVRHRSGTVTVQGSTTFYDAQSTVTMDPGEVIAFDSGSDRDGYLADSVSIDARTGGSARVYYQYRRVSQGVPLA